MIPVDPVERAATAAEYVVGTLTPAERDEVEQALPRDTGLQQDVYFWQDKLLAMTRMLTLEPETGSPIGRPTGPILYVGRTAVAG